MEISVVPPFRTTYICEIAVNFTKAARPAGDLARRGAIGDGTSMAHARHPANRLARAITRIAGGDAGAGILLIAVAAAAMILANSPLAEPFHALFHHPLGWSPVARLDTVHAWINDGLMAVFFFVVGLEIKREVLDGALSDARRRRLPVLAAAAGMAVPAAIYLAVARGEPAIRAGWAIPAATDIAFAVGVLALLGKRVSPALRLFLLTVAIVDDLGAVVVIALFYTPAIAVGWALAAAVVLAALIGINRAGASFLPLYLGLGLLLWLCVLFSGIHATIAGVLFAFTIPLRLGRKGDSMLLRLEHALVPWNSLLIVPLFGLANAGVSLAGRVSILDPVPLGVAFGLFAGKQAGVLGAIYLADRTGLAPRPAEASWAQLWGMAILCGIGFTMSLFIAALAFPADPLLVEEAKLGILAGSLASAILGYAGCCGSPALPPDATLPDADVRHAGPWLLHRQPPVLQQLHRDAVGRADERHVSVARGPVDRHAAVDQPLAGLVDVVHLIGEMAEVAAAGVVLRVPVVRQLHLGDAVLAGRGEEDEREAALLAVEPAYLLQPDQVEEADRRLRIGDADHGVEIAGHADAFGIIARTRGSGERSCRTRMAALQPLRCGFRERKRPVGFPPPASS